MSVFTLDAKQGNPVTTGTVDKLCSDLGVSFKDAEKYEYTKLLAVFHDASEALMQMENYISETVYFPDARENTHGAWAWKCDIRDKRPTGSGLLEGKSFALKDMISVKGVSMLMGTNFIRDVIPDMDATCVTRVLEAGGHITGKAVCENLCHSATSHSSSTGIVENPHCKGYSSGGSSSRSGVLVALGEVWGSIGADQGGSIRVLAANCGIVGLKPTFGLIPYTGCGSNEPTNDHVDPMTRTVSDNALFLQAVAGTDNIDDRGFAAPKPRGIPKYSEVVSSLDTEKPLAGKKVGIITESLSTPATDLRVVQTFRVAAARFEKLGATVSEVSVPIHSKGAAIWTGVSKTGGFLNETSGAFGRRGYQMVGLNPKLHPMQQENWDHAYSATKNIHLNGLYAVQNFPTLLAKAGNLSRKLRDAYDAALDEFDILITPTLPYVATTHAAPDASPIAQISTQIGLKSDTAPFHQTGHPILALPIGMLEALEGPGVPKKANLPVSMQIIGRWWDECTVYRFAGAWENANNWRVI